MKRKVVWIVAGVICIGAVLAAAMLAVSIRNDKANAEKISRLKEKAASLHRQADDVRRSAERNEKIRQWADKAFRTLSLLNSESSISNSDLVDARILIADLSKYYGELNIRYDENIGKFYGIDSAHVRKAKKDKADRIAETESELKLLEEERKILREIQTASGK